MTVEIELLSRKDSYAWNEIVGNSPDGTLFHSWDWLEILERHSKTRLSPVLVKRDGTPLGVIPLFFQKKGIIRMVFSPPPRGGLFYLGPVLVDEWKDRQDKREADYLDFHKAVEDYIAAELRPDYTRISLPPGLTDPRPYGWSGYTVEPLYDYVTDLTKGEDHLLSSLPKKQRQGVNRTIKKGVIIESGGKDALNAVLDLMEIRYEQQQKAVSMSRQYLMDLFDKFGDNMTILTAVYNGEIITGMIDLHYRSEVLSWIGNPKPRVTDGISPNALITWEGVRLACRGGFKSYVTLSAAGNERLHEYYSSKFEPKLATRFAVKKSSFTAGVFEKGYILVVKPLKGKFRGSAGNGD